MQPRFAFFRIMEKDFAADLWYGVKTIPRKEASRT
ncbi:hypothetical protein T458_21865 [Brevibacillus panacihumi W25]|uniref:Uncharacterized protein n=1 Tax=Brevibacillus panacihumi W25 TaxID=1408254 RepID=V6M6L7_9BACL|nr:hypothetical protein T458_21865 [Brevibacillus panacihumi W25]